jgi:NADH dehydrogenase
MRWIAREIGRDPSFVELPDMLGGAIAHAGFLPGAPITKDQWMMLQRDNVVAADADGFAALGIEPTPLAAIAPHYLVSYRRNGRFAEIDPAAELERAIELQRNTEIDRAA